MKSGEKDMHCFIISHYFSLQNASEGLRPSKKVFKPIQTNSSMNL